MYDLPRRAYYWLDLCTGKWTSRTGIVGRTGSGPFPVRESRILRISKRHAVCSKLRFFEKLTYFWGNYCQFWPICPKAISKKTIFNTKFFRVRVWYNKWVKRTVWMSYLGCQSILCIIYKIIYIIFRSKKHSDLKSN